MLLWVVEQVVLGGMKTLNMSLSHLEREPALQVVFCRLLAEFLH